ncbi:hypothetical protein B0T16DRAFT_393938 [Cercophora newfieldiana]|uniref:Uncharacterized protein n=1 Tax=Cercophora newfieldiana TaxID=92897 RepID=A0AA39XYK0_9PEZI|nr:hypothetical protein B0T16DRAFT_393938 [Cercophora newfieldiana]
MNLNLIHAHAPPLQYELRLRNRPGLRWDAVVIVKCEDLAGLMRNGFHLSSENFFPEENYCSVLPQQTAEGFTAFRTWVIRQNGRPGVPAWRGEIVVWSQSMELLHRFQPKNLSRDTILDARVWRLNGMRGIVFQHDNCRPDQNINCMFGDNCDAMWFWPPEVTAQGVLPRAADAQHEERAKKGRKRKCDANSQT